jgi:hypothetical protein
MNPLQNDLNILRHYHFLESDEWKETKFNRKHNNTLLGVKNGHLAMVDSKDITGWNLFLRIFGAGILAHTHISLKNISKHLGAYHWKNLQENDKALINVQKIVAKNFHREIHLGFFIDRRPSKLLSSTSNFTHTIHGRFYLTKSTTARDFHQQMPKYMRLIRIDENGVETPVQPTQLINSKLAVDSICIRNTLNGILSTQKNPYPHMGYN